MIGYSDRKSRGNRSLKNSECSSTPAPSWGCMFCIDPPHKATSSMRQSPKYFHVKESGPRGAGETWVDSTSDFSSVADMSPLVSTDYVRCHSTVESDNSPCQSLGEPGHDLN